MKIGIIDIGSNSVRLMLWADGKTLYKRMQTTRLGEGLSFSLSLKDEARLRTANAVKGFLQEARVDGAEEVYAFATAAVRSADNGAKFVEDVKNICGISVDVISGEEEAQIGLYGALGSADGGIIDVGGASTEVTVRSGGKIIFAKSVNVGTVRILDRCGRNLGDIKKFVAQKVAEYGEHDFSSCSMYAVGGTASRLGAIKLGLKEYSAQAIHGTKLTSAEIHAFAEKVTKMPVEQIRSTTICSKSADLIGGGAELMASVMDKLAIKNITVSESDNLEGYLKLKILNG